MIGEILATGDEIRTGALIDSNSAHIARAMMDAGVDVVRHQCVGDRLEDLVWMLQEISRRADVAVVTGGLGPTLDDRTAEAAARAAGVNLVLNPLALNTVEAFFKARQRKMADINRKQAYLPQGAECLSNPIGTAAGFALRIERCTFFFLPGVPREMHRMLADSVLSRIGGLSGGTPEVFRVQTISTFGLPESNTAERLCGFDHAFPDIQLGLRAKFPEIQIKLYARGRDEDDLKNRMAPAQNWVVEKMADYVFSNEGQSMPAVVGALLKENGASLAIAESCTGGLISHMFTDVPGSSEYFLFSGVTYSNHAKQQVLGVSAGTLETYGAVHEHTAKEMAAGARNVSGATYGLSTSGIAGPDGGTADKPVGTVCIGLATPLKVVGQRFTFLGLNRDRNKAIFAMTAMDILRRHLLKDPGLPVFPRHGGVEPV
jgi:nicotinamide-nucleotide amidase